MRLLLVQVFCDFTFFFILKPLGIILLSGTSSSETSKTGVDVQASYTNGKLKRTTVFSTIAMLVHTSTKVRLIVNLSLIVLYMLLLLYGGYNSTHGELLLAGDSHLILKTTM